MFAARRRKQHARARVLPSFTRAAARDLRHRSFPEDRSTPSTDEIAIPAYLRF